MNLSIKDRVVIMGSLPRQGKLIEMQTASGLMEMIKFTPEEIHAFGLRDQENGSIQWDHTAANYNKEITLLPEQIALIKKGFITLDEQSGITIDMIDTINKINAL